MSADTWRTTPSRKRPGWLVVIGPYDEAFIDAVKTRIDPRRREWMPGLRAWTIHESEAETLDAILVSLGVDGDLPQPSAAAVLESVRALGPKEPPGDIGDAVSLVDGARVVASVRVDDVHLVVVERVVGDE